MVELTYVYHWLFYGALSLSILQPQIFYYIFVAFDTFLVQAFKIMSDDIRWGLGLAPINFKATAVTVIY
jgi:hypothetical protein